MSLPGMIVPVNNNRLELDRGSNVSSDLLHRMTLIKPYQRTRQPTDRAMKVPPTRQARCLPASAAKR